MILPTYEQAADECRDSANPSALAWFITENEPSGIVEESKFRRELEAVIVEAEQAAALRQQAFTERKQARFIDERADDLLNQIGYFKAIIESRSKFQFWYGHAVGICTGGVIAILTWSLIGVLFS
jgi:hypothetical protein